MATTLAQLAELVRGEYLGDGETAISGAATLTQARAGDVTLIDNVDKLHKLSSSSAVAVVAPKSSPRESFSLPVILVDDVHAAFTALVVHFRPQRETIRRGVSPQAIVSPTARLGENVEIQPLAFIDDGAEIGANSVIFSGVHIGAGCRIGENVTIYPNAVLHRDTTIGDRCIIHACAVIGSNGFGYRFAEGKHLISAQLGNVIIGNDVEIGAGSTIDRGTYDATLIGDGTKIDNLVMIAHNCRIGKHNLICSQVGVAGSTTTGDFVVMAGQVGVRDHVEIGDGAILGAKAGVANDVPAGAKLLGAPAIPEREQKLLLAAYFKLPEMRRQMKQMEHKLQELQQSSPTKPQAA